MKFKALVELSRAAEGLLPCSLLRNLFPKLALGFIPVILLGALSLRLPYSATQKNLRLIDALFTSTSTVCVTGLAVLDIGKEGYIRKIK